MSIGNQMPHGLEAVGAVTGVLGTYVAAFASGLLFYTFVAYAISNVALYIAAKRRQAPALQFMQIAYGLATVIGLVNHSGITKVLT